MEHEMFILNKTGLLRDLKDHFEQEHNVRYDKPPFDSKGSFMQFNGFVMGRIVDRGNVVNLGC